MLSLAVLFGGVSSEHEVSCCSAVSVIRNLDKRRYDITVIGITKDGRFLKTTAPLEDIATGAWEGHIDNCPAVLSPDRSHGGLLIKTADGWAAKRLDCVWPILHGKNGEDGTIQGLCELAGLPYVSPGITASGICMDKSLAKRIIEGTGIRQADYYLAHKRLYTDSPDTITAEAEDYFRGIYPLFVKPSSAGSSVGVSKAKSRQGLKEALRLAFEHDTKVLVEETIIGREVEVAVLGNWDAKASVVGEVLSAGEFYDYDSKYIDSRSRTVIPAEIPESASRRLREAAVLAYRALGCEVMSRVDFFLTHEGEVVFNELNTIPGFTNISMYPKLWEATDIGYSQLLDRLVEYAMNREK